MSNILLLDDQKHATIMAALRYYQKQGMGDPSNRTDAIHDIATCNDAVISLDESGIDELCQEINFARPQKDVLSAMKEDGLTIGECITAFAGVLKHADLLEAVLDHANKALEIKKDFNAAEQMDPIYADWLYDLICNFADDIDDIETVTPSGVPGPIVWQDGNENRFEFMPSTALLRLLTLARNTGLPTDKAQQAEDFCIRYGNKLDAILTAIQTA